MLMKTDSLGIPRFTNRDLIDMIYSGNIDKCHIVLCDQNDDIDKFNTAMEEQGLLGLQKYISLDVDEKTFDNVCQSEWFMPEEYKEISVKEFLKTKLAENINTGSLATCMLSKEWQRVEEELLAFEKHNMINLLDDYNCVYFGSQLYPYSIEYFIHNIFNKKKQRELLNQLNS